MSATIKYKGNTIANITATANKTLKTSGKYCEADIVVENVQDGGIVPTGQIDITENGTFDVTNFASALVNVEGGSAMGYEFNVVTGTHTLDTSSYQFKLPFDFEQNGMPVLGYLGRSVAPTTTNTMSSIKCFIKNNSIAHLSEAISGFSAYTRTTSGTNVGNSGSTSNSFFDISVEDSTVTFKADSGNRTWEAGVEHTYKIITVRPASKQNLEILSELQSQTDDNISEAELTADDILEEVLEVLNE